MRVSLAAFLMLLMAAPAAAQIKLRLDFPSAGKRTAWVAANVPSGKLPDGTTLEGASAEFSPGSFGPSDKLFVLDHSTGNLAVKPLNQIAGSWKLASSDFSRIGKVTVRVEHGGKPVETANVSLKSGAFNGASLLDRTSGGEAHFFAVPAGSLQVAVQVRTLDGGSPDPVRQTSEVGLRRSNPEPVLIVSIPDQVATLSSSEAGQGSNEEAGAGTGAAGEQGGAADAPRDRGGFGSAGQILAFLLAVAIAAAAVWFGLKWVKANQDKVQAKLSAAGVEIPGQNEGPASSSDPPAPLAPLPPEKIILDDAAPEPVASAPTTIATGEPRLLSADGDSLPLEEGSLEVGREAGLGLSLLDESTVSRRHAEIVRSGSTVVVKDLGSTNGTFVNGVQVQGERELRPGDTVQFGAVKFRFEG